jgi:hypothetical protein
MADFVFNLKGIVFLIILAEFTKRLLISKQYSKYINFAVSIFVVGVMIAGIKGTSFTIENDFKFENQTIQNQENLIKLEYEKKIIANISNILAEKDINDIKIEVEIDDKYNVTKLIVYATDKFDKIKAIIEGLGIKNYEVRHFK